MIIELNGKRIRRKDFYGYKIKGHSLYFVECLYRSSAGSPGIFLILPLQFKGARAFFRRSTAYERKFAYAVSYNLFPKDLRPLLVETVEGVYAQVKGPSQNRTIQALLGSPFDCENCQQHLSTHVNHECLFEPTTYKSILSVP